MDKVVHFEIPVDNLKRAQNFYKSSFDWGINEVAQMQYTLLMTGPSDKKGPTEKGFINGGMLQRQECIVSPVITIQVGDMKKLPQKRGNLYRIESTLLNTRKYS